MDFRKVTLCANQMEVIREFYVDHLGFPLINSHTNQFGIQIGSSELTFINTDYNRPIYHFAVTIAGNQFEEAKRWMQSRVTLNKENNEDEVYFPFLDAHSFYFHDPSGNVVEFIARDACSSNKNTFSIDDVISISEINLTVEDVIGEGEKLIASGFQTLSDDPLEKGTLNFIGDQSAYFLLGPKDRTWFFSHHVSDFYPVTVELSEGKIVQVDEKGQMYITS